MWVFEGRGPHPALVLCPSRFLAPCSVQCVCSEETNDDHSLSQQHRNFSCSTRDLGLPHVSWHCKWLPWARIPEEGGGGCLRDLQSRAELGGVCSAHSWTVQTSILTEHINHCITEKEKMLPNVIARLYEYQTHCNFRHIKNERKKVTLRIDQVLKQDTVSFGLCRKGPAGLWAWCPPSWVPRAVREA